MIPLGVPIRFRDGSGNIYPGTIFDYNGNSYRVTYYVDGATPPWRSYAFASRDDTASTNNTFAVVAISAQFTGA